MNVYIMYVDNPPYYTHHEIQYIIAAENESEAMDLACEASGNTCWLDDDMSYCELAGVIADATDCSNPRIMWERININYQHLPPIHSLHTFQNINFLMKQIEASRDNGELRATILNESLWMCLFCYREYVRDLKQDINFLCELLYNKGDHRDLSEVLLTITHKLEK